MGTRGKIIVVCVLILAGLSLPASVSADATMKFEGSESSSLFWTFNAAGGVYVPNSPYVSNSSTPLVSKLFITVHDSANYNYWLRVGFCYANPAWDAAYNSTCGQYYNPSGAGEWVAFIELNNQNGNLIATYPNYAFYGPGTTGLKIVYTSGDQYTYAYAGSAAFEVQTFFSRYGFGPLDVGGYSSVANANPANGNAVWIGGLGSNNAAVFSQLQECVTAASHPSSQNCGDTYWGPSSPYITNPNICPGVCPYSDQKYPDQYNMYLVEFWTNPY